MEKEEVLKALEKEGRFKEYDDLYRDDVSLKDWVARNEDLIRSNRNIARAVGVDTPHDGVKDSYFKGQDTAKEKYERQEADLAVKQSEKQKLAEEYQRAKDIEDFSEFRLDKGIGGNLAALGMKLTPQVAKNIYIKEGYQPGKLALHGGIGTMANASEIFPGTGPWAKAVTTFGGPAVRAVQDVYEGKPGTEVLHNFAHDAGLNTLFTYMPVKEAYNYVKRVLGREGGQGEKAVASKLQKELGKIDALDQAKAANDARRAMHVKIDNFERQYRKGLLNDTEVLNFADEIEEAYPEAAKRLREHVNLKAKNTEASLNELHQTEIKQPKKVAKYTAEEKITGDKLAESQEQTLAELAEAKADAYNRFDLSDAVVDEMGNLARPLPNNAIAESWRAANPSEFAVRAAEVLPYARGAARTYTGPDRESVAPKEKDNENALDYIISNYSRQWDAGFKPRGGIELEAWKKYKGLR